jgi:broad specificity phosphatase PhoE
MKQLYFVRHGESIVNASNVFSTTVGSKHDLGLTEQGRQQANSGAQAALRTGIKPDLIIASPLKRAQETAAIIADAYDYATERIMTNELFVEYQIGELEGTRWTDFWDNGNTYEDLGKFTGAETVEQTQQRAARALEYLRSRPEDVIVVVSHSGFGRSLRRVIEGNPYTDEFKPVTSLPHGEFLRFI